MSRKGQMQVIGLFLIAFTAVIVGLSLYIGVGQNIGETTLTNFVANETITLATAGSTTNLQGKAAVGTIIVTNATSGAVVPTSNYTILNNQLDSTTGELTAQIQSDGGHYAGQSVNVSYTSEPTTYVNNSGTRGVISLIAIFMAIVIAFVFLEPTMRSGVMDIVRR